MMDRIKVTVSREDGSPICLAASEVTPDFITDVAPILIVKKDGGTVETIIGNIDTLLEFTARQLEGLGVQERRLFCEAYGINFYSTQNND